MNRVIYLQMLRHLLWIHMLKCHDWFWEKSERRQSINWSESLSPRWFFNHIAEFSTCGPSHIQTLWMKIFFSWFKYQFQKISQYSRNYHENIIHNRTRRNFFKESYNPKAEQRNWAVDCKWIEKKKIKMRNFSHVLLFNKFLFFFFLSPILCAASGCFQ